MGGEGDCSGAGQRRGGYILRIEETGRGAEQVSGRRRGARAVVLSKGGMRRDGCDGRVVNGPLQPGTAWAKPRLWGGQRHSLYRAAVLGLLPSPAPPPASTSRIPMYTHGCRALGAGSCLVPARDGQKQPSMAVLDGLPRPSTCFIRGALIGHSTRRCLTEAMYAETIKHKGKRRHRQAHDAAGRCCCWQHVWAGCWWAQRSAAQTRRRIHGCSATKTSRP